MMYQIGNMDCAAACLSMVLGGFRRKVATWEVRKRVGVQRDGASVLDICDAAQEFGLSAEARSLPVEGIPQLPIPAILLWKRHHYVVLTATGRRFIEIHDPAVGRQRLKLSLAEASFSGVGITFQKRPEFTAQNSSRFWWRRYFDPLWKRRVTLLLIILFAIGIRAISFVLPFSSRYIVDNVITTGHRSLLNILTAALIALVVSSSIMTLLRSISMSALKDSAANEMSELAVTKLIEMPYALFESHSLGDIVHRLDSARTIVDALGQQLLGTGLDAVFALVNMLLLGKINLVLTLWVIVICSIQLAIHFFSHHAIIPKIGQEIQGTARLQTYECEIVNSIAAIKLASAENAVKKTFLSRLSLHLACVRSRERTQAAVTAVSSPVGVAAPFVILIACAHQVMNGSMSVGTMIAFSSLSGMLLLPLTGIVNTLQGLQILKVNIDRLNDLLSSQPESEQWGLEEHEVRGEIVVENLSFQISVRSPRILQDISFGVRPFSRVAIVGRTGCGKSTLGKVLGALYQPTNGTVYIDGREALTLSMRSLRQQIGFVPQGTSIFSDTILNNISLDLGAEKQSDKVVFDDVVAAAKASCIHDEIVAMPLGYDTFLSGNGANISGGQRQRLCIARALLKHPKILILDEATSEVDLDTEAKLYDNIKELGCTQIIIAHRLQAIRDSDEILVMDRGRIVERGKHSDLIALAGHYGRLFGNSGSNSPPPELEYCDLESIV